MNTMYLEDYKRWAAAELEDPALARELKEIAGDDEQIRDRFAVALKFGTAGLRGVLGAGTNQMNIYVVRQATQGLANWVKTQGGSQSVAISYDSRINSDVFAKTAACVLAANGIHVRIYDALMPVPALSFATRYYKANAGIMITASHNPAKYNGYKAYGPDGCQMTDDAAAIVYAEIQKTDILTGAKRIPFEEGLSSGMIQYVGEDCKEALYDAIKARSVRPGLCKTAGLKLVYSPLNGSGLVPVTRVLHDIGIDDITIVPEQQYPDGHFPTCPYPNPEIFEALKLGLELAEKSGADLMLATDPDADRVGIAIRCPDGSYELVSGNEVGVLLLDFICKTRKAAGTLPKHPVAVTTIVSTAMADLVAAEYGVELRRTLTGFKFIGEQIGLLEREGHPERFVFGFEESYGYLSGSHVRDKDGVNAVLIVCEAADWYRKRGMTLSDAMDALYREFGYYACAQKSVCFSGAHAMQEMAARMARLREDLPETIAGFRVAGVTDYLTQTTGLPRADVLEFRLEPRAKLILRPSGTEPKLKLYLTAPAPSASAAKPLLSALEQGCSALLKGPSDA